LRSVGGRLAEALRDAGVDVLFGVPGGQTLPLYQATRALGLTHVVMRDERAAACAADAFARVAGRIGVCDATVGPGVTNLVSGLAEAYASSIPVLAIVADIRRDREHLRHRAVVSQALDQRAVLAPVVKWVGRVDQAEALDDVLSHALRVATTGRSGPVALEIPEDVFVAPAVEARREFTPADGAFPRFRGSAPTDALDQAAAWLAQATRPLVLAGGGVHLSAGAPAVAALARHAGIPIVTTINGKGTIDETDPLAAGVVGLFGSARALAAFDQADVVLVLGSKLDQFTTHGWRLPHAGQRVIHVDSDAEELGRTGAAALLVLADVRDTAVALTGRLAARAGTGSWVDALPFAAAVAAPSGARLDGGDAARAISDALSPGDVVVCDASYASGWGAAHVRVAAGRTFVAPRGLAGIGWSGGAALGARLAADPARRVVVLAGDGGWAYGMAEVETAARLDLDIVYVILNNSALAWINHGEEKMGMDTRSTFLDVDFAAIARALGGRGQRVGSATELAGALRDALEGKGPAVIDVATSADTAPTVSLREARQLLAEA
jgi:acetolactate synthase-1/2/3 large subunit